MIILADFCSISSITYSAGEKLGKREKLHWERNLKAFRIRPQIIRDRFLIIKMMNDFLISVKLYRGQKQPRSITRRVVR